MIVGSRFEQLDEASRIDELNRLIAQWREPGFVRVKPERVIPDATNRDGTGLSVNHLHYIASNMMKDGFTPRDHATGTGHDLPIFVREHSGKESALGATSLRKWKGAQAENTEYPPARPWQSQHGEEFYCSLGNGHFFQASARPFAPAPPAHRPVGTATPPWGGPPLPTVGRPLPTSRRRSTSLAPRTAAGFGPTLLPVASQPRGLRPTRRPATPSSPRR